MHAEGDDAIAHCLRSAPTSLTLPSPLHAICMEECTSCHPPTLAQCVVGGWMLAILVLQPLQASNVMY